MGSRRLGTSTSNASIACWPAGNSSCSLIAVFYTRGPKIATPRRASWRSLRTAHRRDFEYPAQNLRFGLKPTAFVPVSYLCTCWCVTPRALPYGALGESQLRTPHPDNRADFPIKDTITPALHRYVLTLSQSEQALQRRPNSTRPKKKPQPGCRGKVCTRGNIEGEPGGSPSFISKGNAQRESKQATYPATPRPCQISGDSSSGSVIEPRVTPL